MRTLELKLILYIRKKERPVLQGLSRKLRMHIRILGLFFQQGLELLCPVIHLNSEVWHNHKLTGKWSIAMLFQVSCHTKTGCATLAVSNSEEGNINLRIKFLVEIAALHKELVSVIIKIVSISDMAASSFT